MAMASPIPNNSSVGRQLLRDDVRHFATAKLERQAQVELGQ